MQIINDVINKLYLSIENDGFKLLETIGNISDSIFKDKTLSFLFDEKVEITIHSITFFLIFISLSYYIYSSLLSENNIIVNFKMVIQTIIISIISLNSFSLCKEVVNINYTFTVGIEELFSDLINEDIKYTSLKSNIDTIEEYIKQQDKIGVVGIKNIVVLIFFVLLLVVLSIRYVLFILLVIISPLAIIALLNSKTNYLFSIWLKYFFYCIAVQNVNKILLFICISAKENNQIYGCILLGAIILIYKVNRKVGEV